MRIVTTQPNATAWCVLVARDGAVIASLAVTTPAEATALAAVAAEFWPDLVCRVVRPGGQTATRTGNPVRQTETADQTCRVRQTGSDRQTELRTVRQTAPAVFTAMVTDQTDPKGDQ